MIGLAVLPLEGMPEIEQDDDLAGLLHEAAERAGGLGAGDVVVVAQKVVSKAEGRIVHLKDVEAGDFARANAAGQDPRHLQVILDESTRIVRMRPPFVIAETAHGFVCGSAGVDASNTPGDGTLVLLPVDPDASAQALRRRLSELAGVDLAVIVSDSFGRPWRHGTTDVAIGVAGFSPVRDLRGVRDRTGYELRSTRIAVADEIACAAELVMGKTEGIPAAIVRGLRLGGEGTARELVMPPERDLFR
ncbi:MAG: coenzyme F420-0:L-glutamate ligase [Actinobacteria bacterium]|nr:coenzyme F420-0:L-glutamate ligase [Actinomycetota bacterium]